MSGESGILVETIELAEDGDAQPFRVSERYRSYVVWLLFSVYVLNFVDRQILTILMQPIKQEFKFSDTQLGLLGGLAFALLYSALGIPIARRADRGNRVSIITLSLLVWSVFTALTGLARTFTHLLFARVFARASRATGDGQRTALGTVRDDHRQRLVRAALSVGRAHAAPRPRRLSAPGDPRGAPR